MRYYRRLSCLTVTGRRKEIHVIVSSILVYADQYGVNTKSVDILGCCIRASPVPVCCRTRNIGGGGYARKCMFEMAVVSWPAWPATTNVSDENLVQPPIVCMGCSVKTKAEHDRGLLEWVEL